MIIKKRVSNPTMKICKNMDNSICVKRCTKKLVEFRKLQQSTVMNKQTNISIDVLVKINKFHN